MISVQIYYYFLYMYLISLEPNKRNCGQKWNSRSVREPEWWLREIIVAILLILVIDYTLGIDQQISTTSSGTTRSGVRILLLPRPDNGRSISRGISQSCSTLSLRFPHSHSKLLALSSGVFYDPVGALRSGGIFQGPRSSGYFRPIHPLVNTYFTNLGLSKE